MIDQKKYISAVKKMIEDATDPTRENKALSLLAHISGQTISKPAATKAIGIAKELLHGAKASRPLLTGLIADLQTINDKDVQPMLDLIAKPGDGPNGYVAKNKMPFVESTINYPQNLRPTTRFLGVDPAMQFRHMVEELGEIARAMRDGDADHAAEEAADLQQSAETFITNLGKNGDQIRKAVIDKNEARGYYKPETGGIVSKNLIIGLCEGPIESVSDVRINGKPYECFTANTVHGVGVDQPVIVNEHGGKQSDSPYCFNDLDPRAMLMIAERSGYGRKKYGPKNWTKIPVDEHLNHAMAHIYAWLAGDKSDEVAGGHMAAAGWRIMAAIGVAIKKEGTHN